MSLIPRPILNFLTNNIISRNLFFVNSGTHFKVEVLDAGTHIGTAKISTMVSDSASKPIAETAYEEFSSIAEEHAKQEEIDAIIASHSKPKAVIEPKPDGGKACP